MEKVDAAVDILLRMKKDGHLYPKFLKMTDEELELYARKHWEEKERQRAMKTENNSSNQK